MSIKTTLLGAASVAVLALAAGAAPVAAEDREFEWSITIGGTSDYIFRGVSLSNENPAAQGSIDIGYGIFYAGAWASNLDTAAVDQGPWELDLYAGVKPVWGHVTFDFGTVLYLYPAEQYDDFTYVELKAGASVEIVKSLTGSATFWYTPSQSNYVEGYAIEGGLAYEFSEVGIFTPSLSGLVGYQTASETVEGQDDYVYWNVGLTLGVEKFSMDFRYWDTDISDANGGNFWGAEGLSDERFVFSAKVTLP